MGRKLRLEYYGAIYHIIHRGNNKAYIFQNKEEKIMLLKFLGEVKEIFDFQILAYVIMDNHYHFLIKTYNIPISKIMHRINTKYAKYYNLSKNRSGSPFEDRYRSIIVQNEGYFLRLIRYIHNNPVYANISKNMIYYKWSSDIFYRMNVDNIVDIDVFLEYLSLDREEAIIKYKSLMDILPDKYSELRDKFEDENVIGTEEFKNSLNISKGDKKDSLDNILRLVCPETIDYKLIKEGSRKRYLKEYKCLYIVEARKQNYSTEEIGKNINITGGAVRKLDN